MAMDGIIPPQKSKKRLTMDRRVQRHMSSMYQHLLRDAN